MNDATIRNKRDGKIREAGRVSYELRNKPRSPWSLCGSVVEHRSAESEGLRFDSSWGLRIFSLSHARDKTKKTSFFMLQLFKDFPRDIAFGSVGFLRHRKLPYKETV